MSKKIDPSKIGKKGGNARAKSLSSAERSEIARKAASARWAMGREEDMPRALCGGQEPLRIGKLELPCYVLEEGVLDSDEDRRVITVSGLQQALGMSASGGSPRLASFATSLASNPSMAEELSLRLESPIEFTLPAGGVAKGYSALILGDLCDVILEARRQGKITPRYKNVADAAEIVMRGLANVAIIALVDEATGYEKIRRRLTLADLLDKYLSDKLNPWTKTFPDEYYENLFRLKGWDYENLLPGDGKPAEVGKITRDIVYRNLAPGIVQELERQNPYVVPGRRLHKHHQWLSMDIGHAALREHLAKIITVMDLSDDWLDFRRKLDKVFKKRNSQEWFDQFFDD